MKPWEIIETIYDYSEHRGIEGEGAASVSQIIGPAWKLKLALQGTARDNRLVDLRYKRSSTIGSGLHLWAERALTGKPDTYTEHYMEERFMGFTVTGSLDILTKVDGDWSIMDIKTGYGTKIDEDKRAQWKLQMSLYRWLVTEEGKLPAPCEEAYVLFISQSNNYQEVVPVDLLSLEETEAFMRAQFEEALRIETEDCHLGVKYDPCRYCDYLCPFRR